MSRPLNGVRVVIPPGMQAVDRNPAGPGFIGSNRAKIRSTMDEKQDVVDHIGIAHDEGQVVAGMQPVQGFVASKQAHRPNISLRFISMGFSFS